MSDGVTPADMSGRAWAEAATAEAEAYAEAEADARAEERARQEREAAQSEGFGSSGPASSPGRGASPAAPGGSGRTEPLAVGLDGRTLTPGERTFLVKVPPEDASAYAETGVTVIPDGAGGYWVDTRSVPSVDIIEKAPPPTHWLPDYGGHPPPSTSTPSGGDPWPPPPSVDPPPQPSLVQADDLSPKGLFKLGAAILAGIGKLLGKEAAERS